MTETPTERPQQITDVDELKRYIAQLESRSTWAMNEIERYRSARTMRIVQVFGDIKSAPGNISNWLAAPAKLAAALAARRPEKKPIERRRFNFAAAMENSGMVRAPASSARSGPESLTVIGSMYKKTFFALLRHEVLAGVAELEKLRGLKDDFRLFQVRPDDYDHVFEQSKATAFVFDLEYAARQNPYWRGVCSMDNIPLTIACAECLQAAKRAGLPLFLIVPENPLQFSMLGDLRWQFDVEIRL